MGGEDVYSDGAVRRTTDRAARVALRCAFQFLRLYWVTFRPRTRGAMVAVRVRGRLLCIRNSYRRDLGLPGGRVGGGEEDREAAVRELGEEVGILVDPGVLVWVGRFEFRYEFKRDRCALFELLLDEEPKLSLDRREVVWAGFCSPDELAGQAVSPGLQGCLQSARIRGRRGS